MKHLYSADNISISQLSPGIMYCNWVGPQSEQAVMKGGKAMLEILKASRLTKVLNDNSEVTGPWTAAVTWTVDQWFPAMFEAGLQRFAWICSPDIFADLTAQRAIPPGTAVKLFKTYADGLKWLTEAR